MNGTMVDDMLYHENAWYEVIVNQLKAPITREEMKHQCYGKQVEMFHRIFGTTKYSHEEIKVIGDRKEATYRVEFLPHLKLIDGLDQFLERLAARKYLLAIGTAAPIENIDFVLDTLDIRKYFSTVVGPDDVSKSKPDPEVFLKAAERIKVDPKDCLVFEDVPKGIEAARHAGMDAIGITSYHTRDELMNSNVIGIINDYNDPLIRELA